jgi:predicted RNase H-like HicB family nuclease
MMAEGGRAACAISASRSSSSKEEEDAGYFAWSPSLPGCVSSGDTIEATKRRMREAVTQHVSALLAHGEPAPRRHLDA